MDVHTPSTYTRLSPKKFPQNGRRIEHVGRLSIRSSLGVGGEEIVIRTKVSVEERTKKFRPSHSFPFFSPGSPDDTPLLQG